MQSKRPLPPPQKLVPSGFLLRRSSRCHPSRHEVGLRRPRNNHSHNSALTALRSKLLLGPAVEARRTEADLPRKNHKRLLLAPGPGSLLSIRRTIPSEADHRHRLRSRSHGQRPTREESKLMAWAGAVAGAPSTLLSPPRADLPKTRHRASLAATILPLVPAVLPHGLPRLVPRFRLVRRLHKKHHL